MEGHALGSLLFWESLIAEGMGFSDCAAAGLVPGMDLHF